jgi:hypothetical protein
MRGSLPDPHPSLQDRKNRMSLSVPSPSQIASSLLKVPAPQVPDLPTCWNAQLLLTPFGGTAPDQANPGDQLIVAAVDYDATTAGTTLMRAQMYLLESLRYYDFLFETVNGTTTWYWLVSDPSKLSASPTSAYGPFQTTAQVPKPSFLADNGFVYVGSWNVVLKDCANFVAAKLPNQAGTWYTFDSQQSPLRIMNVNAGNDYSVALLGAYYLANFCTFSAEASTTLSQAWLWCTANAKATAAPSPMLTLADLQNAMAAPPSGKQMSCTLRDIQAHVPGISVPAPGSVTPPTWTDQVASQCYMIGQDAYPYYCEVWYDWEFGDQLTVFVQKNDPSTTVYDARLDELLPKGVAGPGVQYNWAANAWKAYCRDPQGSFVPMPRPDFVKAGRGTCRASIANNASFGPGTVTIWSVGLGDATKWSDFWYWFDDKSRGLVFSLAPATSLTMIDYQTFEQNAKIDPSVFNEPTTGLPSCGQAIQSARRKARFM